MLDAVQSQRRVRSIGIKAKESHGTSAIAAIDLPGMGGIREEGSYLARGSSTWEDPGDSRSDVREERPIECQDVWPLLAA